jgi:GTPase SAR1 family protein
MDSYSECKAQIEHINRDVRSLFSNARSIPGMEQYRFGEWEKTCEHLPRQLAQDTIRVAIVGSIKSGKSTFLNSIFNGDYVKRGAGVITSIVTRVRRGERLRAKLFFKSIDEVNADMRQALVLFPSSNWRTEDGEFDIRQQADRRKLQRALSRLGSEQLITSDTRNINMVLLTSYLRGYDAARSQLGNEGDVQLFVGDRFAEHKLFVGDETLAVYLKDVLLEVNSSGIQSDIEIADCQGSDSSNPLHLAMIQDYLLLTHLIVYVISSRTGLRRADIRFLSMIKKMGILDNILFVINCDFSEHESIEELKNLVTRVSEELAMIKPGPDIYTFSALFNMFSSQHDALSPKEQLRFEQWKADNDFVAFSNREAERFQRVFDGYLAQKRFALLLNNHIERLGVIVSGIDDWVDLNRSVLSRDSDSVKQQLQKIKAHQKRLGRIQSAVKKTLTGALPEIKKELQQEVQQFFNTDSGNIVATIEYFIDNYNLPPINDEPDLETTDFSQRLYLVFQEFKQALDAHVTEVVNPRVIRFVQTLQTRIQDYFHSLILPFDTMIGEAHEEYRGLLDRTRTGSRDRNPFTANPSPLEMFADPANLKPPALVAVMDYSTKIKTEALMRLGLYRVLKNVKGIFKKSEKSDKQDQREIERALQDGIGLIKRETRKSLAFQLKDYRENLKFGYLFELIESASAGFSRGVLNRFQAHFSDLSSAIESISNSQDDKQQALQILEEMEQSIGQLEEKINGVRTQIEQAS